MEEYHNKLDDYLCSIRDLLFELTEHKLFCLARRLDISMNDINDKDMFYKKAFDTMRSFTNEISSLRFWFEIKKEKIQHRERSNANRMVHYSMLSFMNFHKLCLDLQGVILSFIY